MRRKHEDDDELLADGESIRVRLDMMDGVSDPFTHNGGYTLDAVQQSIAGVGRKAKAKQEEEEDNEMDDDDFEDGATVLHDGTGNLAGHRPGYVFSTDSDPLSEQNWNRQRVNDEYKADVSNRYKGGLEAGDKLHLCGHTLTVTGVKDNGNLLVRDTSTLDGEALKQAAYSTYDSTLCDAYKKKRSKCEEDDDENKRNKQREPSESELKMAGPLSDGRQEVKDKAYSDYEAELANRWRK